MVIIDTSTWRENVGRKIKKLKQLVRKAMYTKTAVTIYNKFNPNNHLRMRKNNKFVCGGGYLIP